MAEGRLKSDSLPTTFTINIQNAMPKNTNLASERLRQREA